MTQKLLSLQEAVAECVADPSLAFHAWTGGTWYRVIGDSHKVIVGVLRSYRGGDDLTFKAASEVLSYWQVKPLAEVEKELGVVHATSITLETHAT